MDGLAGRLRVLPFGSEGDGSFALTFDGHLAVRCIAEPDGAIRLVGKIGKLPVEAPVRSATLHRLLQASLARAAEPGIPALDDESGELILHHALPAGRAEPQDFERTLEAFVNRLAEWQRRLTAEAVP